MSDSNVYAAERIIAKRKNHGVTQYLLKWKGYSLKDSTWEPAENILDRSLLTAFEKTSKKSKSSSSSSNPTSSAVLNSSGTSINSSSHESRSSAASRKGRGRPRKSYTQQRQEQLRLQRHIEQQQIQKTRPTTETAVAATIRGDKKPELVFNPQGFQSERFVYEEIVYTPELTKETIIVTDVTSDNLTVTISECKTPDGFFKL